MVGGDGRWVVDVGVACRDHQLLPEIPELLGRVGGVEGDNVADCLDRRAGPRREVCVEILVEVEEEDHELVREGEDLGEVRESDVHQRRSSARHRGHGVVE